MEFFAKQATVRLIKKLPKDDPERREWLIVHSDCEESKKLRMGMVLRDTGTTPDEKVELLYNLVNPQIIDCNSQPFHPQSPQGQAPTKKNW
jgi:hypothetical protein